MSLSFKPLDLTDAKSVAAAVLYRRDCHVFAMGHENEWLAVSGLDGEKYIDYLQKTLVNPDAFVVQAFDRDKRIGQIEARYLSDENIGYVNLYYLIPEYRYKGYGKDLENYVLQRFSDRPMSKMRLTIWHENKPSLSFYQKQGWVIEQERENPGFFYMTRSVK